MASAGVEAPRTVRQVSEERALRQRLPLEVGIRLGAAWVADVARAEGVRVLFVKGLAAETQGLRPRGEIGGDIDVLVEPPGFRRLVRALVDRGWLARPLTDQRFQIIRYHSVTLVHPEWPCDIDVHYYFPGFFATADQAFETLAADAEQVHSAGGLLPVPAPDRHALLLAVNALRSGDTPRARAEMGRMAERFTQGRRWAELQPVIARLRAGSVLQPFARRFGLAEPVPDLTVAEARAWRLWVDGEAGGAAQLVNHLRTHGLRGAWALMRWAVWRDGDQLRLAHPEIPPGAWATMLGNIARWGRGVRQGGRIVTRLARRSTRPATADDATVVLAPEFGGAVEPEGTPHARIRVDGGHVEVTAESEASERAADAVAGLAGRATVAGEAAGIASRDGALGVAGPTSEAGSRLHSDDRVRRVPALEVVRCDVLYALPHADDGRMPKVVCVSGGAWLLLDWCEAGPVDIRALGTRIEAISELPADVAAVEAANTAEMLQQAGLLERTAD